MSSSGTDTTTGCTGNCSTASTFLTVADVQKVMAQGIAEAQAENVNATIAVTDRVGNVLGVYRMGDPATRKVTITTTPESPTALITAGLEGIQLPVAGVPVNLDQLAAIAKAVTGAYLSSEGNAFSTRVASQIVQDNFNPGEAQQPGGPLFGVQFSSLACSDFIRGKNADGSGPTQGPQRTPLGLSADPGGFPLYKGGAVVGAVGVIADGIYGIDKNIGDKDNSSDEKIAIAASFGFAAPVDRRGDRITVDGKQFQYTNSEVSDLTADPAKAPAFSSIPAGVGQLIPVIGYTDATIKPGTAFGQPESGVRADGTGPEGTPFYPGRDAFLFVDANNVNRFPPIDSPNDDPSISLKGSEVQQIISSGLDVANRARAQIRRPVSSQVRVTISVIDSQGAILGIARTRDAPVFGSDVSLQKARTAALFSSPSAATFMQSLPPARYLRTSDATGATLAPPVSLGDYVSAARTFFNDPNALTGGVAFSDRGMGNIARPYFPDGINQSGIFGPFSKPPGQWSVFSSGVQLDTANNAIIQHVLFAVGAINQDVTPGCAGVQLNDDLSVGHALPAGNVRVGNGFQIFAGAVPIYRGSTMIGAIGISGDGIDQDDMVAFLGLFNGGVAIGQTPGFTGVAPSEAPKSMRDDVLQPQGEGTRLRYVQCPLAPFINSSEDRVCDGK